jgi:hypothetical protein
MPQGTQQQPIELPAVTAYGEQPERSLLQQLVAQFIQRANEPKDPFAIQPYNVIARNDPALLESLRGLVRLPGEVKRRMGKSVFHLPHHQEVMQQKQREAENVSNWMKTWFRSPITRERLAEGGRSPQDVEALASKAENLQFEIGMPDIPEGLRRLGRIPKEHLTLGVYDVEEDKSYIKPYTTIGDFGGEYAGIPYFRSKPFFEQTAAHELMHQMTIDKMTDKEAKLISEGVYDYKKVMDMASKQKGAWRAFGYKHEPYMKGGRGGDPATLKNYFYYAKPEEIYARIMSVRRSLGLLPGQSVAKKMLETIKNSPAMNDLLRYMPMKHVQKLMNTLAVKEEDTPTEVFV